MSDSVTNHWRGEHLAMVSRDGWEFVTRTNAQQVVMIVAVTDDRRLVLVEQFRPPVGASVIELPAGLVGDHDEHVGESAMDAAQRELREETGYEADAWREAVRGATSPGLSDEIITVFIATGLRKVAVGGGDHSEDIAVHTPELDDLTSRLIEQQSRNTIIDLKVFAALPLVKTAESPQV